MIISLLFKGDLMSDLTIEEQQSVVRVNKVSDNAIVLSNVVELVTSVVTRVAGKDIADTIGKESLSRSVLSGLVANRIKEKLLT